MRYIFCKNPLIIYFLTFVVLWSVSILLLLNLLDTNSIIGTLIYSLVLITTWIMPVFFYLYYIDKVKDPIHFLKLDNKIISNISTGIIFGVIFVSLRILINRFLYGATYSTPVSIHSLGLNTWVNDILLIGLLEEIPFRGFLLQKLMEKRSFMFGNIFTSIAFLLIHIPGLIYKFSSTSLFIQQVIYIFLISYLLGYLFKLKNSVWFTATIHSLHDFWIILLGL